MTLYPTISLIIFYILYLTSLLISSVNMLNSSRQIVVIGVYIILYLFSTLFVIRHKMIYRFLVFIGISCGILFVVHYFLPESLPFLTSASFQFVLPTEGGHNHLGDLLGLTLISLFSLSLPVISQIIFGLFFVILMIISFSKSAFLALSVTMFVSMMRGEKSKIFIFLSVVLISLFALISYSKELSHYPTVGTIQQYMNTHFQLKPKSLWSSRDIYIAQMARTWVSSSLEYSFFGFGPGNIIYASNKSAKYPSEATTDTHNLLLNFFVESGSLPALWFLLFFLTTAYVGIKNKNPLFFLLVFLFMNFQTDYTYRIPLFFALFFIFSGQIAAPYFTLKTTSLMKKILGGVILIVLCLGIYSYRISTEYRQLNKQLLESVTSKNMLLFDKTAKRLEVLTPYDELLLTNLHTYRELFGNTAESVRLMEKIAQYNPHSYLAALPHQLELQKKMGIDVKIYLQKNKIQYKSFPYRSEEKNILNSLCKKYGADL